MYFLNLIILYKHFIKRALHTDLNREIFKAREELLLKDYISHWPTSTNNMEYSF